VIRVFRPLTIGCSCHGSPSFRGIQSTRGATLFAIRAQHPDLDVGSSSGPCAFRKTYCYGPYSPASTCRMPIRTLGLILVGTFVKIQQVFILIGFLEAPSPYHMISREAISYHKALRNVYINPTSHRKVLARKKDGRRLLLQAHLSAEASLLL
jgi:hypothetical protein